MVTALRRRLAGLLRTAAEFRRFQAARPDASLVAKAVAAGHIDRVVVHADGTVAAEGWAPDLDALRRSLTLTVAGRRLSPSHAYRVPRSDVGITPASGVPFAGAVVEWVLGAQERQHEAALEASGALVHTFAVPTIVEPAYPGLRTDSRVLGRDNIYSYGPPVPVVSSEVVALARTLPPPILDFGCGAGALVRALRSDGIEAYGLELDQPRIRQHLLEDVRPWVTLYDGGLPSPFAPRQFQSVSCCEVLEHLPNPGSFVAEFERLAAERLLVTVPDISAIPRGFQHGVVPWHLLESTHVNFFTQHSLAALLSASGARVEIARIGRVQCDRLQFFTSLAAMVESI